MTLALSDFILHKHTPKIPHTLIIQCQYHSLSYDHKFRSSNQGKFWYHVRKNNTTALLLTTAAGNVISLVSTPKKERLLVTYCLKDTDDKLHLTVWGFCSGGLCTACNLTWFPMNFNVMVCSQLNFDVKPTMWNMSSTEAAHLKMMLHTTVTITCLCYFSINSHLFFL